MVGWHHRLDGHELEQTQKDSDGQRSLGMLQFTESQRVGPNLVTEQEQSTLSRGQVVLGTDLGVLLLDAWYSAPQFSERLM